MPNRDHGLKLLALDREGLGVISAHAQNTCVRRSDMVWLPRQHRFVVAGMRYDWVGAKTGPAERVSSVLAFRPGSEGLAPRPRRQGQGRAAQPAGGHVREDRSAGGHDLLAFADGALVRLEVECVEVELCDMGRRLPAEACPGHALTDASAV